MFVIVSAAPVKDLEIPEEPYSFGVLETAQAFGDFASLDRVGRRALLLRFPGPDAHAIEAALHGLLPP